MGDNFHFRAELEDEVLPLLSRNGQSRMIFTFGVSLMIAGITIRVIFMPFAWVRESLSSAYALSDTLLSIVFVFWIFLSLAGGVFTFIYSYTFLKGLNQNQKK